MALPLRIDADINQIMLGFKQAIIDADIFNVVRIVVDPTDFDQDVPDDTICFISQGEQVLDQASTAGGGVPQVLGVPGYNFIEATILVTIWNRCALDTQMAEDIWLTDPAVGLNAKLMKVIQVLQVSDLFLNQNVITAEPIRFVKIMTPGRLRNLPGWSFIQGLWSVPWTLSMA